MFNVAQALGVAHMRFNTFLYAICLVFVCTILSFPSVGAAQNFDVNKCNLQKYTPRSLACNWRQDGSGALSDAEYKQLCAKAAGFTINSKQLAGIHNGVNRQFVDGASLMSSAVQWRANVGARKTGLCLAKMTINGVLRGTSKTSVFEGYVIDFVNINGKILVNTFGWY